MQQGGHFPAYPGGGAANPLFAAGAAGGAAGSGAHGHGTWDMRYHSGVQAAEQSLTAPEYGAQQHVMQAQPQYQQHHYQQSSQMVVGTVSQYAASGVTPAYATSGGLSPQQPASYGGGQHRPGYEDHAQQHQHQAPHAHQATQLAPHMQQHASSHHQSHQPLSHLQLQHQQHASPGMHSEHHNTRSHHPQPSAPAQLPPSNFPSTQSASPYPLPASRHVPADVYEPTYDVYESSYPQQKPHHLQQPQQSQQPLQQYSQDAAGFHQAHSQQQYSPQQAQAPSLGGYMLQSRQPPPEPPHPPPHEHHQLSQLPSSLSSSQPAGLPGGIDPQMLQQAAYELALETIKGQMKAQTQAFAANESAIAAQYFQQQQDAYQAAATAPATLDLSEMSTRVKIAGIHPSTQEDRMRSVFSKCGEIVSIKYLRLPGVLSVMIEFDSKLQAAEAVKFHGRTCQELPGALDDRAPAQLSCSFVLDRRTPSPIGLRRKRRKTPDPEDLPPFDEVHVKEILANLREGRRDFNYGLLALQKWLNEVATTADTKDQVHQLLRAMCAGLDSRLQILRKDGSDLATICVEAAMCREVFAESQKPKVRDAMTKQQRATLVPWAEAVDKLAVKVGVQIDKAGGSQPVDQAKKQKKDGDELEAVKQEVEQLRIKVADAEMANMSPEEEQIRMQIEALQASAMKAQEDAQQKLDAARSATYEALPPTRQEAAMSGILAIWLQSKPGGATIPDMVQYMSSLVPDCDEAVVQKVLERFPAIFGKLGTAGKLWSFKAYNKL